MPPFSAGSKRIVIPAKSLFSGSSFHFPANGLSAAPMSATPVNNSSGSFKSGNPEGTSAPRFHAQAARGSRLLFVVDRLRRFVPARHGAGARQRLAVIG